MYCPYCAAQNETGMKFCRACGQDLSLVSEALSKSGPMALLAQVKKELKESREQRQKPWVLRGVLWINVGLFISIMWLRLFYRYPSLIRWPYMLEILVALMFFGLGVREFVKYKRSLVLEEQSNRKHPSIDEPQYGSVLGLQSVTEATTQRLDVMNRGGKSDREVFSDQQTPNKASDRSAG